MADNDKTIQNLEGDRRQDKEVNRRDAVDVIAEKRPPALRRWPRDGCLAVCLTPIIRLDPRMAGVDEHLRPLLIAIAEATIPGTAPVPAYHPSNSIAYITDITLDNVEHFVGKNLGTSDWIEVDQSRIDQFAECTGDRQWIDVDVERTERESPFQTTIADGYLSLSLVAALAMDLRFAPKDASVVINYGLGRVRFITPVKAGQRVRLKLAMASIEPKDNRQFLIKGTATLEIENNQAPALAAEILALIVH